MSTSDEAVAMNCLSNGFFESHNLPIGVQLFTLGPDLQADFAGSLGALAALGYGAVELAGLNGPSPRDLRTMFDAAGLVCKSAHIPAQSHGSGVTLGDLDTIAEAAETIGLTDVVMPFLLLPDGPNPAPGADPMAVLCAKAASMSVDDYLRMAEFMNEKGRFFKSISVNFGYHNHNVELRPLGSSTGFEILLENTDPDLVHFQMDVGWVVTSGRDPLALIADYPGRFRQVHIKDIASTANTNFDLQQEAAEVGTGCIDWSQLLPSMYAAGIHQFYVERDPPYPRPRLEHLEAAITYLKTVAA